MHLSSKSSRVKLFFRKYPVISWTMLVSVVFFIVDFFAARHLRLSHVLGLSRMDLFSSWAFYQPVTYIFLHGDLMHLFFNMFVLFLFGRELEELFGSKRFAFFYLFSGVIGGLVHIIFSPMYVVGASAAVFGLLLAYAVSWPNRQLLVFFLFPLKVKYYVLILGGMEFMLSLRSLSAYGADRVAHWAHLGGLLGGGLLLLFFRRKNVFSGLSEFNRKRRLRKHKALIDQRIKEKEKVDLLLDKISESGMDSLSRSEQRFLNRASKEYYQDFPPE